MEEGSLKENYPHLMKEWAHIDNLFIARPGKISPSDNRNVWWVCHHCQKRYYMPVRMRVAYDRKRKIACPYCAGKSRKK